jgi:hypothetical protein
LNPFDETLLACFKITLKRWIESIIPRGITIESILLDTHYMYDRVNDMVELLDVIDKTDITSFLQDNNTSIFIVVSTTHIIKEVLLVWKGPNWESFLNTLLNAKVTPKVIIHLCDKEFFKFLFTTTMKSTFIMKM